MTAPKRRIKNYLIQPKYQLMHAGFICAGVVVGMSLVGTLFFIQFNQFTTYLINSGAEAEMLINFRQSLILGFLGVAVLLIFVYGLFSIIWTHRVFGALFGIEEFVQQLIDGKYEGRLNSRSTNQTLELTRRLNVLTEKLSQEKLKNN